MARNKLDLHCDLGQQPEGGFLATVRELPGCITEGDTLQEALANAVEAIELYVSDLAEHGELRETGTCRVDPVAVSAAMVFAY